MSETQNHAAPYDNGRIEVGQQLNDGTIPLFDKGPETQCIVALVTENTLDGISRQQGNADRLAACWNTLAGIPTQDLPAVRDLLQWAIGLGNLKSSIPPAVADRLRHLTPAPSAFDEILGQMVEFKYRFGSLISDLEREVMSGAPGALMDDFFLNRLDEFKTYLGSRVANECGDDPAAQEAAISSAEDWVSNNVHNDLRECIAATLWLSGAIQGAEQIRREIDTQLAAASPAP